MTWIPLTRAISRHNRVYGNCLLAISSLSAGALALHLDQSVLSQPDYSVQEEEKDRQEMMAWSSSLNDPNHKNFNPFFLS